MELKNMFLAIAIYFLIINLEKIYYKKNLSCLNILMQTIAIVGFLTL